FQQFGKPLDGGRQGLGIGLALVKRLVELHGGSVSADSEGEGRGSTFHVRLPMVTDGRPAAAADHPPAERMSGMRILVVDDSQDVARSLALLLQASGNTVNTARDGEGAVKLAQSFRPDVVLMDIGMPGKNGYESARRMREQSGGRRMIVLA